MSVSWHQHPGVRSGEQLTLGERAADRLRNGMGSWVFIFAALAFLAAWIGAVQFGLAIDNHQLTILNLVLSCLAALQGGILLIAAKRADKIASELATHDYDVNQRALSILEQLQGGADRYVAWLLTRAVAFDADAAHLSAAHPPDWETKRKTAKAVADELRDAAREIKDI